MLSNIVTLIAVQKMLVDDVVLRPVRSPWRHHADWNTGQARLQVSFAGDKLRQTCGVDQRSINRCSYMLFSRIAVRSGNVALLLGRTVWASFAPTCETIKKEVVRGRASLLPL